MMELDEIRTRWPADRRVVKRRESRRSEAKVEIGKRRRLVERRCARSCAIR